MTEYTSPITGKTNIIITAVAAVLLSLFIGGGSVSAQEESAPEQEAATSYSFSVEECDTQTHLARRAIQIEEVSNDEVTLTPGAKVFAETALVQQTGVRDDLSIGDQIMFEAADVKSVISDATNLSDAELANWETYAADVDFDAINTITPAQTPPGVTVPTAPTDEQSQDGSEEASDDGSEAADDDGESDNENEGALNDDTTPWYWWVVGAGAIGGVWYLLWNRAEEE